MAKGVKKIKESETSNVLENYTSRANNIICIKPNQMVNFVVSEWYEDTTPADKQRDITWLWQDQKKTEVLKTTVKLANTAFGVNIPNSLCGSYAFYLEATLFGVHDPRKTGLHVYGKCDKKITSSSWTKTKGVVDTSEISYGHNLFITLKTEGVNGDILSIEVYSEKNPQSIKTKDEKCIDGKIVDIKFSTLGYNFFIPGVNTLISGQNPQSEKFYIKVKDITGEYLTNASGNDRILSFSIANKVVQPIIEIPTNTAPLTVDTTPVEEIVRTEGIVTAYFAKEEFSLETTDIAGQHEYKFKTSNTNVNKDNIATIIKNRVDPLVKADKKYAKLDDIKNALGSSYEEGQTISFNLYKLGAKFIKINSAPLEEEVYVVVKTFLLDGKEVSITIKEKETIVVNGDAAVPVLEAKENGEELTALKATVENGIAKVKIKLRPKADEDLKKWKEKLLKGKKEEAYTYTFKSEETTITVDNKKKFAAIILKNAKEGKQGNTKIAAGKTAFADDVEKALENGTYISGDTISFDTYKTQAENLWLKAECQGDTIKHEKEFLKRDGEYFVIGGSNCSCNRDITENELDIILKKVRGSQDTTIFTDDNCNLDDKSKASFLNELNKVLKKYEINTCIRKVHFLAQMYHETGRLRTTLEYASGSDYNPGVHDKAIENGNTEFGDGPKYRGRGLMQLTWKDNYKLYKEYSGIDIITNYAKVSDELKIAVDSAGWFFKQGKKFNSGNTWTVPETSFSRFDGSTGKQFNKTRYTYNGTSYTTVNINLLADQDYIDTISWLINGGDNGRTERREYLKKLKEIDFFKCGTNKWHDPVDNPMLCLYSQGGESKKPWHGSFGPTIRDGVNIHTGMDLFAKPGTNVYSCVKGEVVRSEINSSMFGELIVIKVIDEETFKSRRKNPFVLKYSEKSEIELQNFDHNGPFYLVYAHLKERKVAIGETVNAGKIIGLTGTSGVNGVPFSTKNPHLHFEIMNVEKQAGLDKKCNPGVYLTYKDEDNLTTSDIAEQEEAKTDSKFWKQ
jgi:predicted chitinase